MLLTPHTPKLTAFLKVTAPRLLISKVAEAVTFDIPYDIASKNSQRLKLSAAIAIDHQHLDVHKFRVEVILKLLKRLARLIFYPCVKARS